MSGGDHPMRYRSDIDGLRAVAVLAVVLFHAGVPALSGGYVGVDVFFVISGFLITSILLKDSSIIRFYQRRARRILPALLAMLAAVLVVGAWLLLPYDYDKAARSAAATGLFGSNFYFWRQAGYFQPRVELMPLLHTWSLGVEEQFYIFFPFVVILARRLSRGWLAILFGTLALGSFGLALVGMRLAQATAVFYLLPPRAWELLAGSVLATGALPSPRSRPARTGAAAAGLALVLAPVVLYTPETPFPGATALPPVLGSALLIWAGTGAAHGLSPLLGFRPLVFTGLISYSLYLWHWPVLALLRYRLVREPTSVEVALAVLLAFGLAVLSWRYIERPFRRGFTDRTIWLSSAAGLATVLAAAGLVAMTAGLPRRFPTAVAQLNQDTGDTYRCPIFQNTPFGPTLACKVVLPSGRAEDADVILWGDSHAQMYVPAFRGALGRRPGILLNVYGCAPVIRDDVCGGRQVAASKAVLASRASTVILAQNWPQYMYEIGARENRDTVPDEYFLPALARLEETVAALRAAGKRVIVVGPVPPPGFEVPSVLSRELAFGTEPATPLTKDQAEFRTNFAHVLDLMDTLDAREGVTVLRLDRLLCRNGGCPLVADGRAVYADYGHFTIAFSGRLAPAFRTALARSETAS